MARIPDAEIEQIKTRIALERLVTTSGVALKRQGADFIGHCPFHADKTPSLVISPKKNLWHCLGACQQGGSVIDWVMKQRGISFRHAVEVLRQELAPVTCSAAEVDSAPELAPLLRVAADRQDLLQHVVTFYQETLKASPEALEYLTRRGLMHPELIDHFHLGYANRTLAYRLPSSGSKAGMEMREQLQTIGLLRTSGHEHFSGSLVIPVIDEQGHITEIYGRKVLGKRLRKDTPMHTYLPGPHQGVWNIGAFKASHEMILCEALIDALTFWCAGFRHVTASYGVSGFNAEHLHAFKTHAIERVYIAYDRDDAGEAAAAKVAQQLLAEGIDCYRVLFPKGMDVNEYALQVKPAEKSLGLALRSAEWMGNGKKPTVTSDSSSLVAESDPQNPLADLAPRKLALSAEAAVEATVNEQQITLNLGERQYRIRGLQKNLSYEQLRINMLIHYQTRFHVDTLDIYSARHRAAYLKQASVETGLAEEILKQDIGQVLLKLEELQEQHIQGTLSKATVQPKLSEAELKAALAFLKSPDLIPQILRDFDKVGIVGETTNKLVGYLAAVSRKLDKPLAVMVQSSSAAGKSSLMEAVLAFMPEEERVQYSAMTGQALFYLGEQDLKHKILAIAEEEGATQTAYALKLLQSEGEVSIASTGKNATTGNLETQVYRVEGPIMLFSTTTAIDIDEELMNRCLVLSVDESRSQTQAIHAAQRQKRTLAGLRAKHDRQQQITLHQNAQRLLRPLAVLNPYADQLTFLDDKTRTRRDHEKYLTLIDTITLLHQYQRPLKKDSYQGQVTEYIEVTVADIALANQLAQEVLGRTLDELPPQTRRLLESVLQMVQNECREQQLKQSALRFSRKTVRDTCGWSDFQVKKHLKRLEDLEYVLIHKGRRGQSFEYELLYQGEGQQGEPFILGLNTQTLFDDKKAPSKQKLAPSNSPQSAIKLPLSSANTCNENTDKNRFKASKPTKVAVNPLLIKETLAASHAIPL
ncbi:hypothetical protein BH10PSE19_BH10PSE19_09690 [soil metagenome]